MVILKCIVTAFIEDHPARRGPRGLSAFPGFGKLLSWLAAIDFAHAGIAEFPTAEETAAVVYQLNAGALGGLVALGAVSGDASLAEVIAAVTTLDIYLERRLNSVQKAHMPYNTGMEEHVLCKYKRAADRRLVS